MAPLLWLALLLSRWYYPGTHAACGGRGSAEGEALCTPSLKLLLRIETPKIRGTIVIMSRR